MGAVRDDKTGVWYKDDIRLYHNGGIIGDKPKTKLFELANKLFNEKPGEQTVKALKGELFVLPKNVPNFITNMKSLVSSPTPNTSGHVINLNPSFHFDVNSTGNFDPRQITKIVTEEMFNMMKTYGFRK